MHDGKLEFQCDSERYWSDCVADCRAARATRHPDCIYPPHLLVPGPNTGNQVALTPFITQLRDS